MAIKISTPDTFHPLTKEALGSEEAKVEGCLLCADGYVMDLVRKICVECLNPPCC